MLHTIRTHYTTHPTSGAGRIVAKGSGMQRTWKYDPEKSVARNHGAAAAVLVSALIDKGNPDATDTARHFLQNDAARNTQAVASDKGYTFTVEL